MSITSIKANRENEEMEAFIATNKRLSELVYRVVELEKRIEKLEEII